MKSAFKTKAQNGCYKGSFAPYGHYLKDDRKLYVRQDNTPNIVKRIFKDYLSGKGFDRIARELYEEGIPTPGQVAGKADATDKWHGSSVRLILENPNYTGDLVQGRSETISVTTNRRNKKEIEDYIIIKNSHEAIITRTDFEAVQQLIKSRKKIRSQQNIHLFTNILFCADCGHGMHFKKNREGYVCGNFNKHGKKACSDHIIREAELANAILADIKFMLSNIKNEKVLNQIEKKVTNQKKKLEKELKKCSKQIESLIQEKIKATSKFLNNGITQETYNLFISDIDRRLQEFNEKEQELNRFINEKFNTNLLSELDNLSKDIIDLKELTPEILNRFVERIEVKADGTPKIFYRFSESSIYFSAFFSNTQHSTCGVCGNISISTTFLMAYPASHKAFKSTIRDLGLQDT
jgi:hypothetical protein